MPEGTTMLEQRKLNAERRRLEAQRDGSENWRLWGPYLSERAWGTVREDYSPGGTAWEYFDHDSARSRAYRWNEDGLGGISDDQQRLCFALALWNGRDPILKERAFGLTGNQGNRGEDVKEYYFYVDATPTHSYLRYLYKYPQAEYPYARLTEENRRRSRNDAPFNLLDTGVFDDRRNWDVEVFYAKSDPRETHIRIVAKNCGPESATLHLLPTLWFRNTWSWGDGEAKPALAAAAAPEQTAWAIRADHPTLGIYHLFGRQQARLVFTENESNTERLWGQPGGEYVKDAFHRLVIQGEEGAVNPKLTGTKAAAWYELEVPAGQERRIDLILTAQMPARPFARGEVLFSTRQSEANIFYDELLPKAGATDHRLMRQALAGMIWCKQFFHYDVERWLAGDRVAPPGGRKFGRNRNWVHLKAADIISMPDSWEYPWFAAWDLAYHCGALALVDVDFAKEQIELLLKENYLHPNGQIPAYEWTFNDVNPPVQALGALKVFRAERVQRGAADMAFLKRVFNKLLLNFNWWINRKDAGGNNVFEGGFLGLDNISVFDRSQPLPAGYSLKQADATGWMAMFALNMTVMALELATEDAAYEDIAIQIYNQFLAIANTLQGHATDGVSLWDDDAGFFKDLVIDPSGNVHRIDVYSLVGLIPLFATEVVDRRLLANVPRFRTMLHRHRGGIFRGNLICACPETENARGEHLLSIIDHTMLARILKRLLDEEQFLAPFGVRSVSLQHAIDKDLGAVPGVGRALIEYVPGESTSGLFGGNSNWRGPIWMPINYTLIQAIEKFQRYLGDDFTIAIEAAGDRSLTLREIANLLAERLTDLYRPGPDGARPALATQPPFRDDPDWKDLMLFYEYFHADTGQGLGASHQTGWTGLLANLVMRRYREGIPEYWKARQAAAQPSAASGRAHVHALAAE
jgi:hypothetical protein